MGRLKIIASVSPLFFVFANVFATPVVWTIDSLVFDDGGTGSGAFSYDADTNTYSDISIVTTAGSAFSGATYSTVNFYAPVSPTTFVAMIYPIGGAPALELSFADPLSNAGGIVAIDGYAERVCGDACGYPVAELRSIVTGQISAVPVPAAVYLFASGLGLLGWFRRKQA